MTLGELKEVLPNRCTIEVDKLYEEFKELDKDELAVKTVHLIVCIESLGNVIGDLNTLMFAVAQHIKPKR